MKVLVSGGTGVIGRALVPLLDAAGHEVVGLARSERAAAALTASGAAGVARADMLDRDAVVGAVRAARPDAIVHLATAIPDDQNPKKMPAQYATTNRLRTEGTENLLAAAGDARFIAQSVAFAYHPGGGLADEDAELWTADTPAQFVTTLAALQKLEELTARHDGLALRFGHLYGPGTAWDEQGAMASRIRSGKLPLVGGANAVFSFLHAADAASSVVAALDRDVDGVLNIVDDDPTPLHRVIASMVERPPRRLPVSVARLAVGAWGVAFMNRLRGADNARARLRLDWRPSRTSWRGTLAR